MIALGEETNVATLNRSVSVRLAEAVYILGDDVQMCSHAPHGTIRVLATTWLHSIGDLIRFMPTCHWPSRTVRT